MVRDRKIQSALRTDNSTGFVTFPCGKKIKKKTNITQQYLNRLKCDYLPSPTYFHVSSSLFLCNYCFQRQSVKWIFILSYTLVGDLRRTRMNFAYLASLQLVEFVALPFPKTLSQHPWIWDGHIRCYSFQSFFLTSLWLCCSWRAITVTTLIIRLDWS